MQPARFSELKKMLTSEAAYHELDRSFTPEKNLQIYQALCALIGDRRVNSEIIRRAKSQSNVDARIALLTLAMTASQKQKVLDLAEIIVREAEDEAPKK